jgi:hypothetical protein
MSLGLELTIDGEAALDPSLSVKQFCALENISAPFFYTLADKPAGYYAGDSYRIPNSERLKWRARRMAAAPEIAARQSEAARSRAAKKAG